MRRKWGREGRNQGCAPPLRVRPFTYTPPMAPLCARFTSHCQKCTRSRTRIATGGASKCEELVEPVVEIKGLHGAKVCSSPPARFPGQHHAAAAAEPRWWRRRWDSEEGSKADALSGGAPRAAGNLEGLRRKKRQIAVTSPLRSHSD